MSTITTGHILRPGTEADLSAAVELFNRRSLAIDGVTEYTREEIAEEWRTPGFDTEHDTRLAVSPSGEMLGYAEVWDLEAPYVRVRVWMCIDPRWDHEVGGLGDRIAQDLLAWARSRAMERIDRAPEDARVMFISSAMTHDPASVRWLESFGMSEDRRFYRMMIGLADEPATPWVPEGYRIRVMQPEDHWNTFLALHHAFQDHFGVPRNRSAEESFHLWKHFMIDRSDRDPELNLIAVSGDGVVGAAINFPSFGALTHRGWVAQLGVKREHRRKGLAEALLRQSFVEFFRSGKTEAGLGVDSGSLTNAPALYERCGMHVAQTSVSFVDELRRGEDYTNRG